MERYLCCKDVGRELGITASGARWLAETGRLRVAAVTPSGLRLFEPSDVEKLRKARLRKAQNAEGA